MSLTIHVRGVGGQALPFIVTMLGRRAAEAGVSFSSREVFGMAQRGGSVFATLEIGEIRDGRAAANEVCGADADPQAPPRSVVLGLELLEGLRGFSVLRPGERAIVSTARVIPPGSWATGRAAYPTVEEVTALAEQFGIDLTLVDAPVSAPWQVVQAAIDLGVVPLGPPGSPGLLGTRTGSSVVVTVS